MRSWRRGPYLVKLAGGKLRIMRKINPFVAELSTNLVDAIKASHYEHLEVELGCNTHKHV